MLTGNDERCKVSSKQMGKFGYCYFYDVVKVMILQRLAYGPLEENFAAHNFNGLPAARTLTTRLSCLRGTDEIRLGRFISTPCSIKTRSSGLATPVRDHPGRGTAGG